MRHSHSSSPADAAAGRTPRALLIALAVALAVVVAVALAFWAKFGAAVFLDTIAAGIAACF